MTDTDIPPPSPPLPPPPPLQRMPEAMFSVLISGKAYSGKTTTAENLLAFMQIIPRQTKGEIFLFVGNFGDVLKEQCAKKVGVDVQLFYTQAGKNTMLPEPFNMTAGRFLQVYGESERQRDPEIWVDHLLDKARTAFTASDAKYLLMLIGDCRHPNEIDLLRRTRNDGIAVRLRGDPSGAATTTTRDMNHISEIGLDDYTNFDMLFDTNVTPALDITRQILSIMLLQKFVWMGWRGVPFILYTPEYANSDFHKIDLSSV